MSEDPRLAQIRALCAGAAEAADEFQGYVSMDDILAILDAPPVDATPPQGIDGGRVHGLMCNVYAGVTSPSAAVDAVLALVRSAWAPAQPSTSGAVWVLPPLPPLPHDWRWGEIDGGNEPGRRVAVSVCWACEAVAWNEPDFLALDSRPCPGHPEVALVREAFAAHPEWFASDSARRQIAELLKVPTWRSG